MFELRKIVTITENTYREGGRPCPMEKTPG